jgi:hypothetical protein
MRRGARCEYGVLGVRCGVPALTTRQRPANSGRWAVCQYHADFLDRLRDRIEQDRKILDRLADT